MKLDKFRQKSQDALFQAQQLTRDSSHQAIEPVHLLLALTRQDEGVVPANITKVAGSVLALREEVEKEIANRPKVYGTTADVGLAQATVEVLNAAERYAKGMQDDYVSTEHILLGLADSIEGKRLSSYGLTKEAILSALWCAPTYKWTIQRELQDPLAVKILAGEFKDGETVLIDQVADGLSFSVAVGATEN